MAEESHLEEMRAAIKADRERAAKRGNPMLTPRPPAPEPEAVEPPARAGVVRRLGGLLRRR